VGPSESQKQTRFGAANVLLRIVPKPFAHSFDFIGPRDPRQSLNLTGKRVVIAADDNSGNELGSVFTLPSCAVTSPASFQRNASCAPQRSTYLVELKAVILPNLPRNLLYLKSIMHGILERQPLLQVQDDVVPLQPSESSCRVEVRRIIYTEKYTEYIWRAASTWCESLTKNPQMQYVRMVRSLQGLCSFITNDFLSGYRVDASDEYCGYTFYDRTPIPRHEQNGGSHSGRRRLIHCHVRIALFPERENN